MYRTLRLMLLLIIAITLFGCGQQSVGSQSPSGSLFTPSSVTTTLESTPASPFVAQSTELIVNIEDDLQLRDGMRIELRQNDSATRIYNAEEVEVEQGLQFVVQVEFEQSGENEVYLHFNVGDMHVMQRKLVEVLANE